MKKDWGRKGLNGIRYALARYLESKGRTDAALALYDRVFSSRGLKAPAVEIPPIFNLEYAQLCLAAGRQLDAYDCCIMAIEQLSQPNTSNTKPTDVDYLLYCCKYLLSKTTSFVDSEAFTQARSILVTYDQLVISTVSRTTRGFINVTPEWGARFDEWFQQQVLDTRG